MRAGPRRRSPRSSRARAARGGRGRVHLRRLRRDRDALRAARGSTMTPRRPDFAALDFDAVRATGAPVAADPKKEWETPERIPQRSIYTAADLAFATHLG